MLLFFPVLAGLFAVSISDEIINSINTNEQAFLYKQLLHFLSGNYFKYLYKFLIAVFLILNGFLLNKILTSVNIFRTKNWYHGFIYLILIGLCTSLTDNLPILVANSFILFSLLIIFKTLRKPIAVFDYLNAGMLFSISFLFWINTVYFIPIIFISLFILRTKLWRDAVSFIIGFTIPVFIIVSFYYLIFSNYNIVFDTFNIIIKKQEFKTIPTIFIILGAYIILFSLFSFFKMLFNYNTTESDKQDYYKIFFALFFISLSISFIFPISIINILPFAFISIAIPFSVFFISLRKKILAEIIFDIFLILVVVAQTGLLNKISF